MTIDETTDETTEGKAFSWFPKFTNVYNSLENEGEKCELMDAVLNYGTYNVMPIFETKHLHTTFLAMKEDIDNSKNQRYKNKGGRPKKSSGEPSGERQAIERPRCPDCGGELLTKSQCLSAGMKNRGECGKLYCAQCGQLFDAGE